VKSANYGDIKLAPGHLWCHGEWSFGYGVII